MTFTINIPMWLVYVSGVIISLPILGLAWIGFMFMKDFSGGFGPWR